MTLDLRTVSSHRLLEERIVTTRTDQTNNQPQPSMTRAAAIHAMFYYVCVVLVLAVNVTALNWSATPAEGEILYRCVGSDVTISWRMNDLQAGDVISSIVWDVRGSSEQMVAMFSRGNFIPLPAFSRRVTFVPNAGIRLSGLTMGDAGNYSVTIVGHEASGAHIETSRSVVLMLSDDLMTEDHHLHAAQQSVAEFSPLTQQFHAILTCGKFTYLADPPVTVVWQTPDGSIVPSTEYVQGRFRLLLPNPVTAGVYRCRISAASENKSCSHGQSASVTVDAVLTRLMLLEAENMALTAKVETMNHELKNENAGLNTTQQTLQAENAALKTTIDTLNSTLQAENAVLKAKVLTMEGELQLVKNHTLHPVAFTATLSSALQLNSGHTLVLPSVLLNQGDAYDNSTGLFTAPVSGVYYFSAFAVSGHSSLYTSLILRTTNTSYLFRCYAYKEGGHYQTCSLHGAVHLGRGEQAWLVPNGESYFWSKPDFAFSGFLLSVD